MSDANSFCNRRGLGRLLGSLGAAAGVLSVESLHRHLPVVAMLAMAAICFTLARRQPALTAAPAAHPGESPVKR